MNASYDTIAKYYDRLAKLVYGQALISAREYLLSPILPSSSILVVGGGTGMELEQISARYPHGMAFTYVDASAKMVALASRRNIAGNKATFITAPVQQANIEGLYDVVITPFVLDNFTDKVLSDIFALLHERLRLGGMWLFCDFRDTDVFWQRALLRVMYLFFRKCCGIEASKLPDTESYFNAGHYTVKTQKFFLGNFITSVVYIKSSQD